MTSSEKIFVAMSGGVDSAVSAALLLKNGYWVTGIHMQTWQDPKWQAASKTLPSSVSLARKTADSLGIEFVCLDVRDRFYEKVVRKFVSQYLAGQTPNPCLFCNPQVKWGILQSHALEQGADYFATGHYARLESAESGQVRLLRGVDPTKDQSYVLSMLSQFQLSHSRLPLGGMTKNEVRMTAKKMDIPVADRQDSQDLCFLGDVDYRDFLQRFAPDSSQPGEIVDMQGRVLGEHNGLAFYTIGQRRGIRVAASEPYYVVGKDVKNNRLVVGYADQVGKNQLTATEANWISGSPPEVSETYTVMVRYRAKPAPAILLSATDTSFRLEFKQDLRGITPGQVAVLYQGEECLGGGIIQTSG